MPLPSIKLSLHFLHELMSFQLQPFGQILVAKIRGLQIVNRSSHNFISWHFPNTLMRLEYSSDFNIVATMPRSQCRANMRISLIQLLLLRALFTPSGNNLKDLTWLPLVNPQLIQLLRVFFATWVIPFLNSQWRKQRKYVVEQRSTLQGLGCRWRSQRSTAKTVPLVVSPSMDQRYNGGGNGHGLRLMASVVLSPV
eukprot:Gb_16140 [translate_table: standard]